MIFDYLRRLLADHRAGFFVLIDPDRVSPEEAEGIAFRASREGADAVLVGTSLSLSPRFGQIVQLVKGASAVPVVLFPGNSGQLSADADAILFLSLLSGRNPDFLIGEQVKAAPLVKSMGLETIPTGYLLIESGALTSTQYISNTLPIPRAKPEIAVAHALAAEFLGMRLVYLEAGSGGEKPVPAEMIRRVREAISVPLVVGGGLRRPEDAARAIEAGANFVVVGTALETDGRGETIRSFAEAVHGARSAARARVPTA